MGRRTLTSWSVFSQPGDHSQPVPTAREGSEAFSLRASSPGSPLRDTRGALGRARALRAAARNHTNLADAADVGLSQLDRDQPPLIELPDGRAMLGQGVVEL